MTTWTETTTIKTAYTQEGKFVPYVLVVDSAGVPILDATGSYLITGETFEPWTDGAGTKRGFTESAAVTTSWSDPTGRETNWS